MDAFLNAFKTAEAKVHLDPTNPLSAQQAEPFKINGIEYRRKANIAKEAKARERVKSSRVYDHGEVIVAVATRKEHFYCYLCERTMKQCIRSFHGTSSAREHLEQAHKIGKDGQPVEEGNHSILKCQQHAELVHVAHFKRFKEQLIMWIIHCHIALSMLENAFFRDLLMLMNTSLAKLLPYARSTLRKWIFADFEERKKIVQAELSSAVSSIHISFDIWTSPNFFSIIAVYSHFVDRHGKRQRRLLAFRRITGKHTGENIAAVLIEVVKGWNITAKRVGWFMSDNAKNNDTAVDIALQTLCPYLSVHQRRARRLRCFGHTCNLIARAVLLGKGAGKTLGELELKARKGAFDAVDKVWRAFGGLGRLHNIIRYIRASPMRREEFSNVKGRKQWSEFDDLEVSCNSFTRLELGIFLVIPEATTGTDCELPLARVRPPTLSHSVRLCPVEAS